MNQHLKSTGFALAVVLAAACGDGAKSANNGATNNGASNNGATNNGASNNGASNNGDTNNGATNNGATNNGATNNGDSVTIVTVGVFERLDETTYQLIEGVDPLVFEVGVACQTWDRRVLRPSMMDTIQEEHDHFNAADDVEYEAGTLTWLEYGPEHSQQEIDETCAAGVGGAAKTVNATDYAFDGNMGEMDDQGNYIGFYLKIIDTE